MVLNKKAQTQPFFLFMIGVIVFLVTFSLVSPLLKSSDKVRGEMNCSNSSLETTEKITCTVTDTVAPFILAILIGIGAMFITARLMGG